MLRTGQTAAPLIKVADGAGSKTGMYQTGGSEDPHAPPAMERERIASRRHTKGDAGRQAHTSGTETGFRVPRHPFPVARQGVLAWLRDAKKPQAAEAANADAYGIVAWVARGRTVAVQWFRPVLSYRPNAH